MCPMTVGVTLGADAMEKPWGKHSQSTSGGAVDGTARSRSTSAGSSSPRSSDDGGSDMHSASSSSFYGISSGLPVCGDPAPVNVNARSELPEYDYPVPLLVKNTFIDTDVWRPLSLCDFFQERQVQSCPASAIGAPPGLENQLEGALAASWPLCQSMDENVEGLGETRSAEVLLAPVEQGISTAGNALPGLCAAGAIEFCGSPLGLAAQPSSALPPPPSQAPILGTMPQLPEIPPPPQAPILRLCESLSGPQLGSPALPTVGSANHRLGSCRPCAFLYTKGCANGVQCTFCHLCEAGEKKRRRKEKLAMMRSSSSQGQWPIQEI